MIRVQALSWRPWLRHIRIILLLLGATIVSCTTLVVCPAPVMAADVSVIYPGVKEPYLAFFKDTLRGVEAASSQPVKSLQVRDDLGLAELQLWLANSKSALTLVLGPRSIKALGIPQGNLPILPAAFLATSSQIDKALVTLTYTPDPLVLFSTMHRLDERVKRVHVIINQERWQWLLEYAKQAADSLNMTLVVHDASNLSQSARLYSTVLKEINSIEECVWLPEDSTTLDNQLVLPIVLQSLWDRELKIFSSGLSGVNRGILFGFFPDNYAMGEYLGRLAQSYANKKLAEEPVQPLRQLNSAINLRTAQHIGLDLSQESISRFNLVLSKDVR